ncbi:MAG: hypothetical protein HYW49_03560, partial [Deltaproteobacteria bacterium]|nr:hypothetical protein [Deltaproteobacteria bacterium]
MRDETAIGVRDVVRSAREKADAVLVAVNLDAPAVAEGGGCGVHGGFASEFLAWKARGLRELMEEDFFFGFKLRGVGEVLPGAAAAAVENRARRDDAVGRGFQDFDEFRLPVIFVRAREAGADFFAGGGAFHEHDDGAGVLGNLRCAGVLVEHASDGRNAVAHALGG